MAERLGIKAPAKLEPEKPTRDIPAKIEPKPRYCSIECVNFDKPSCTAPKWGDLNKQSLVPLKCPGYSSPNPGADMEDA